VARRTLEEIDGVQVVTDWAIDSTRFWRLELDLTPANLGSLVPVPATTRWFVLVQDEYPKGLIDILPAVSSGLPGIFPHQLPFITRADAPYRGAKICVATDSEGNLRRASDAEPRSVEDRLAWQVKRALGWIEHASSGTLLAPDDPFELPVYKASGAPVTAFREGPTDLAVWNTVNETIGVADLMRLDNAGEETWVVSAFRSLGGQVLIQPNWGARIKSLQTAHRTAAWLRVPSLIVRSPYAAPSTWRELSDAFGEQGINLFRELQRGTARLHDGSPHPLLIGFPVPELIGGPMHQMHWLVVDLPPLERRAPNGFRRNDVGLWTASFQGTFRPVSKVSWGVTENWHPGELATRGRLNEALTSTKVLLIGAGALGSAVAELLVRAGASDLELLDDKRLKAGNLVRHILTIDQLGDWKADALARHLNAASPNANVLARRALAGEKVDAEFIGSFDLVIETTGDHRVLQLLAEVQAPRTTTYVSFSVSLHARRLYAFLARRSQFPLTEFDRAYEPFSRIEADSAEELPMEGIGCWHPVFPARADEIWLMASAGVALLNDASLFDDFKATMQVIERTFDSRGRFTGLVSIAS
jgi:hypothetical protein